jgi:hypothetical protein
MPPATHSPIPSTGNAQSNSPSGGMPTSRPRAPFPFGALSDADAIYTDSRGHGCYTGPSRIVRLPRVTAGGGALALAEDGGRCVVAGRECMLLVRTKSCRVDANGWRAGLRIVRLTPPGAENTGTQHKLAVGRGGHRADASRNFWDGGAKLDGVCTDVVWGYGSAYSSLY